MRHQQGKAAGICVDKAKLIGSSYDKEESCLNTLSKNADTLLKTGDNTIDQSMQWCKADDRNTTGDTGLEYKGDIQRENDNSHKKHDVADQTRNANTEETNEQRNGATCRPRKRVMFDVDSSTASSSEFVDSSLTSVSSLESDNSTRKHSLSSRDKSDSLIASTTETTSVTLGWKSLKQSDATTSTTGSAEPMVNNAIKTTQENINISQHQIKRNKPLYRINKSTVTYNKNFYRVNEVDKSHKDNAEIDKTVTEDKDTDQVGGTKGQLEKLKSLHNERLTLQQTQSEQQPETNPSVRCKGPVEPVRGLVEHNNRACALTEQHLTHKSQVTSGEPITANIETAGTSETQLDIGNNCKRIRPVIHSNCTNPPDNTLLINDQLKNKDNRGHTELLPHSSYSGRKRSVSQDINVRDVNRNTEAQSSPLLSEDTINKEQVSQVKVDGQREEDKREIDVYNRKYTLQCSDSLTYQVDEDINENTSEDLRQRIDFETEPDFNLEQLEENIEADFEALNSKMNELDIDERGTDLLTTPDTSKRGFRGRHKSGSDNDDWQIRMERHLEGM